MESFIMPVLLYNKVTIAVLYYRLVSLSNQGYVSQFFLPIKSNFDDEDLALLSRHADRIGQVVSVFDWVESGVYQ